MSKQSSEAYRGRAAARALSSSETGNAADALVLGDFDWRDWFIDKPTKEFLRAWSDEVMYRDHYDEFSSGC